MKKIMFVDIHKLKCHEKVDGVRLGKLQKDLELSGAIHRPIIVDRRSYVILDGHHRYSALKRLGMKKIPVYFVDYLSPTVRVHLRRKNLTMQMIKQAVLYCGLTGSVFPIKTTRHLIHERPGIQKISLETIMKGGE